MDLHQTRFAFWTQTGAISSAPGPSTMGAFVPALDPQTKGAFALPLDTHRPGLRGHGPRQGELPLGTLPAPLLCQPPVARL